MKTKTASVRLPEKMYEEIDNVCDDIGCTRNDWIKDTLKDKLGTHRGENTQDLKTIPRTEGKIIGVIPDSSEVKEVLNAKISYD